MGITGANGLQGRRGMTGSPFGPTGPPIGPTGNAPLLTIVTPSSSSISLTQAGLGTKYDITPAASVGTLTVTFPPITELFPVPEQRGQGWSFQNNCGTSVTITFVGGTVVSYGVNSTQYYLAVGQGVSITYGGADTGMSFIVY
jgi:hypothetical protein